MLWHVGQFSAHRIFHISSDHMHVIGKIIALGILFAEHSIARGDFNSGYV